MGIDKETSPRFIWISLSDTPKYLESLRKTANRELDAETIKEEGKKLLLLDDTHRFEPVEYYYDDKEKSIEIHGTMKSSEGETYISMSIPLSDTVFIDIIHDAIKRLNKLKNAMETLR